MIKILNNEIFEFEICDNPDGLPILMCRLRWNGKLMRSFMMNKTQIEELIKELYEHKEKM